MKTTLELLRERLLKDKEIFPHYNEYINGILYDIDNEFLAMEKEQVTLSHINGQSEFDKGAYGEHNEKLANEYYNQNYK